MTYYEVPKLATHPLAKYREIQIGTSKLMEGSLEDTASFVISSGSDGKYYSKNGSTGEVTSGTDASIVIQAALNGLTAGRTWKEKVVIKGDTFLITTTIAIPSYTILDILASLKIANGVTITAPGGIFTIDGVSNVEIIGGLLDCNRNNTSDGEDHTGQLGIFIKNSSYINILGTHFKNGYYRAIAGYGIQNSMIYCCIIEDFLTEYIDLDHGWESGSQVTKDNVVSFCMISGSIIGTSIGIAIDGAINYPANQGNIILGNVIFGGANVINNGIYCYGPNAWGNIISHNIISYTYNKAILIGGPYNEISHNICYLNRRQAIRVDADYNQITNNILINNSQRANAGDFAIEISSGDYNDVIGNKVINDAGISAIGQQGIVEWGTCNYNRYSKNDLGTAVGTKFSVGATAILPNLILPFIDGTTSAIASPRGWAISGSGHFALALGVIPPDCQQSVRMKVWGVALDTGSSTGSMVMDFILNSGIPNEVYTAEVINVSAQPNNETGSTVLINNVISWTFTATNDADVDDLIAGDCIEATVLYTGSINFASPSGSGIATNALFRYLEIQYV